MSNLFDGMIPYVIHCSKHQHFIVLSTMRLIECNQVKWWSDELSKNEYDGVIGLSQGSAMTALLLSMVSTIASPFPRYLYRLRGNRHQNLNSDAILFEQLNHPEKVPDFNPQKTQPIKFAILCSGNGFTMQHVFWSISIYPTHRLRI